MTPHPFEKWDLSRLRWCFRLSLVFSLAMMAVLLLLGLPLRQCRTPEDKACDIIAFELAGAPERSRGIVDAWEAQEALHFAKWNTWLDYGFMLGYANCIALGIVMLLKFPLSASWRGWGRMLAWVQWLALTSDAVENAALLKILYGAPVGPWPQLALVAAIIKFGLVGAGILFLAAAFLRTRGMRRADAAS